MILHILKITMVFSLKICTGFCHRLFQCSKVSITMSIGHRISYFLQNGKNPLPKTRCPEFGTKLYLMKVLLLEYSGVWSTPLLPLLPLLLWPGVVEPIWAPSMSQTDLLEIYSFLIGPCAKKKKKIPPKQKQAPQKELDKDVNMKTMSSSQGTK